MKPKKAMGRNGGNRATHYGVYEDLLTKSIRDAEYNRDQMKKRAQWPLGAVFCMADRIKLVPHEKKQSAVRNTLIECQLSILLTSTEVC